MEKIKVIDVLLQMTDGEHKGEFVLQQRSEQNKTFHYVCQATWAGKFEEGENSMEAVKRECKEELGEVFHNTFNFSQLKFIGVEDSSVAGKDYVIDNYLGEITEDLLNKAQLHKEALPNFIFINPESEIFPLSAAKDPAKCIVVFDDMYRVLNKIFNGNTGNKK